VTVSQPWLPKRFDTEALADSARRVFDTIGNTYRFFALYANLEDWSPDQALASDDVLDRWLRARLSSLVTEVRTDLDAYELTHAARAIASFVVDDLSNWYVRRSRDRFWGSGDAATTRAAFTTLHEALVTVARLLAPFTPFHADWLHRALTGGSSVHLAPFPEAGAADPALERGMHDVRELARLGRAARERVRIRVRQPLRTLHAVVPGSAALDAPLLALVRDELNVRDVRFLRGAEELVTYRAQPNFRVLGKRFGGATQAAAQAVRGLDDGALREFRSGAPLVIRVDGAAHELNAEEVELIEEAQGELVVETEAGYVVALDPVVDDELREEGLARELVNRIQRLRRDTGLAVSDRIRLQIDGAPEIRAAAERHRGYIQAETLATDLVAGDADPLRAAALEVDVDGRTAYIAIARA
jgi:isoleucyl-tRNA synthetase